MNVAESIALGAGGLVIVIVLAYVLAYRFSPEARERRRCRRNHRKVVNRARRPAVRLSAKVPRE